MSRILTPSQVAAVASAAGFSGSDLIVAVSVAGSESGFDPNAGVDAPGVDKGKSIGLWQIYLPAHPEFAGQDLTDPQTNADAAYSIYQDAGNSFTPWASYNSGKNQAFLAEAAQGVNG